MLFSSTLSVRASSTTWNVGTTFSGTDSEYMTANKSTSSPRSPYTTYYNIEKVLFVKSTNLVSKPNDLDTSKPIS